MVMAKLILPDESLRPVYREIVGFEQYPNLSKSLVVVHFQKVASSDQQAEYAESAYVESAYVPGFVESFAEIHRQAAMDHKYIKIRCGQFPFSIELVSS